MIIFEQRYEYKKLQRVDTPEGRKYATPDGKNLPSVTTILSATKSDESVKALDNWKKRVGKEKAQSITTGAANLGTLLHNNLEKYMLGKDVTWGNNMIQVMAKKMYDAVLEQGLSQVDTVVGIEAPLYFPGLYAGTADLVLESGGDLMIGDFKNTIKMKKREWIDDYFIQCVAYAMAHNELYNTNIQKVKIMMVARPDENTGNCDYKNFEISGSEFNEYCDKWLQKLDSFYSDK